jgi:hypothetical protein
MNGGRGSPQKIHVLFQWVIVTVGSNENNRYYSILIDYCP